MRRKPNIKTVKQFGRYEVIGPVKLPLRLSNGNITSKFSIWYFEFPAGRYAALVAGNTGMKKNLLVRIESACIWGHIFESQYCDCKWQLEEAKNRIENEGAGIIIFALDQHGKSVGIRNHFLVYAEGLRKKMEYVVDAYKSLGFDIDYRKNYSDAADILNHFGVDAVRLLSNNPERISLLRKTGIKVKRVSLEAPLNNWNKAELFAKKLKVGHLLRLKTK